MKHRSLLVTGGCGFIGSNFILEMLEKHPELRVINLDALTYAGNPENLASVEDDDRYHFCHGRIGDDVLVSKLLREHGVDAVVNFAAESHVDRSIDNPAAFVETNVLETTRLLHVARGYFQELSGGSRERFRFLHVSTDEVYGTLEQGSAAFSETTPFAPNSPYAASKAASDHLVRSYHHTFGLPVVTTNCSNNYGPFQFPEKLIPLMIANAVEGKPLPVYGDGSNIRDWLYVRDHARAIEVALERGRLGETYCVGGDAERNNLTVVHTVCRILDQLRPKPEGEYADQITFVKDRPGHDFRYAIDASKIANELGWKPTVSFDEGMERTVRWYLENEAWSRAIHENTYQRQRLGSL